MSRLILVRCSVWVQTMGRRVENRNRNVHRAVWHCSIRNTTGTDLTYFARFYLFIYLFIYLLERRKKGEREGEKHQYVVASCVPPTGNLAHNPSMCPDWELNQQPVGLQPVLSPLSYTSQVFARFLVLSCGTQFHFRTMKSPENIISLTFRKLQLSSGMHGES